MSHDYASSTDLMGLYHFDGCRTSQRFIHSAVFAAIDSLHRTETMRFSINYEPVVLLHDLEQCYGKRLRIRYVSRECGIRTIDLNIVA